MRNRRRKGFTLVQMIAVFPVLMVILAIGLQAEKRIVQAQVFENRMLSSQAMMRDVVRRLQADARFADAAVVRRGDEGIALELARGGDTIIYRCVASRIERTGAFGRCGPGPLRMGPRTRACRRQAREYR